MSIKHIGNFFIYITMRWAILVFFLNIAKAQMVNPQQYSIEAGTLLSNIRVSLDKQITNIQVVSGNKIGYYVAFSKQYPINPKYSFQAKITLSESGGKIINSTFFIKETFPKEIEKYRNAEIRASIYQIGLGGNVIYQQQKTSLYIGIQPTIIFYGKYKEYNTKKISDENIEPPTENISLQEDKIKFNTVSLRGQVGAYYPLDNNLLINIKYSFGITNSASLKLKSDWNIKINQNIFQLGIGYRF